MSDPLHPYPGTLKHHNMEKTFTKAEVAGMLASILYRLATISASAENGGQPFDWVTASRQVFAVASENDIEIPEP